MIHRLRRGGLVTAIGPGCGGGVPSGNTISPQAGQMTIKGTVKIQGKLASSGTVEYKSADGTSKSAPISKNGSYSLTAPQGAYAVTVTTPEITRKPSLGNAVLHHDVQRGENRINIEIPPRGQ
jgi:hypothetical protein